MLWSAIGASVFPGASDESKLLAIDYCKSRGLDILKKPCHIVPMSVKDAKTGQYAWRDVIMPGIAEQRITANRTGQYAGQDPPVFGPIVELKIGNQVHQVPEFCTVTVYRYANGIKMAFSNTEYFEEACGTMKDGSLNSMWTKRKRGQLSKCAEAGALRKAFPEETGGMTTLEELAGLDDEGAMRNVTPREEKPKAIQGSNPFNDPRFARDPEPEKQPENPAETTQPATVEAKAEPVAEEPPAAEPETTVADPDRPAYADMVADIREACNERNIIAQEATRRYRVHGVIPKGKKFGDLTEEELFEVWKVRGVALDEVAAKEAAAKEGGEA